MDLRLVPTLMLSTVHGLLLTMGAYFQKSRPSRKSKKSFRSIAGVSCCSGRTGLGATNLLAQPMRGGTCQSNLTVHDGSSVSASRIPADVLQQPRYNYSPRDQPYSHSTLSLTGAIHTMVRPLRLAFNRCPLVPNTPSSGSAMTTGA